MIPEVEDTYLIGDDIVCSHMKVWEVHKRTDMMLRIVLNEKDISQNGLRPFEWRYYYKYTNIAKEKPHMLVCG